VTELPDVTAGELRALRIAAVHTPRTPRSERVERHPHGKQYVADLAAKGLLAKTWWSSPRARAETWEVTALAVELLGAHWRGERQARPATDQGLTYPPTGGKVSDGPQKPGGTQ
jgi:hypothetical protein